MGARAVCASIQREKKTEQPPKLYDLTTLQREANRLFGFTAKQTLDYAQTLYEKRLLTYPRTDSRFLSDDMEQTAAGIVAGSYTHSHNADYGVTHTYLSFIKQNRKQGIDILLLMCYDTS